MFQVNWIKLAGILAHVQYFTIALTKHLTSFIFILMSC